MDESTLTETNPLDAGVSIGDDGIATSEDAFVEQPTETGQETEVEEAAPGKEQEIEPERERVEPEKQVTEPLPREVSKMLRELKDARPELGRHITEVNNAYFQRNAFKEAFPTVEAARAAKATLEALGGEAGIVELQTLREDMDTYDNMIAQGDPKVIDAWFEEARDGLLKLTPVVLSRIEKDNPGAFNSITRPFFVKALLESGVSETINTLAEFIGRDADPNPYAVRELQKLMNWVRGLQEEYKNASQTPAVDPHLQELEAERSKNRQREVERVDRDVNDRIGGYLYDTLQEGLRPLTRGRTLSRESMGDLINGIGREIQAALDADKVYQKNLAALRRGDDVSRIVNYMKSKIDTVRQKAITTVWTRRYGSVPPPKAKTAGAPSTARTTNNAPGRISPSNQPIPILQKPTFEQIDWSKDREQILYMTGKAYLKGSGKFVTWRK